MIRLVLNLLWFAFGGWLWGLLWFLAGCLFAVTIVGLPWSAAAFRIAGFAAWPFGKEVVDRRFLGERDAGTGCLGVGLNVIWFVLAGWYLEQFPPSPTRTGFPVAANSDSSGP